MASLWRSFFLRFSTLKVYVCTLLFQRSIDHILSPLEGTLLFLFSTALLALVFRKRKDDWLLYPMLSHSLCHFAYNITSFVFQLFLPERKDFILFSSLPLTAHNFVFTILTVVLANMLFHVCEIPTEICPDRREKPENVPLTTIDEKKKRR